MMSFRSLTVLVALLALSVFTQAAEKAKKPTNAKPVVARGTVVGKLACSKCDFKTAGKCQTALRLGKTQFVIVSGKAGENLFKTRCTGKLVRVSGAVTIKDGIVTIAAKKSTLVKNQKAASRITLAGKLVCSKCEFKIGKCAAGLKAGGLQLLLEGKPADALYKSRCSGAQKIVTGELTKIEGNTVYLKVTKITDPKKHATEKKQSPRLKLNSLNHENQTLEERVLTKSRLRRFENSKTNGLSYGTRSAVFQEEDRTTSISRSLLVQRTIDACETSGFPVWPIDILAVVLLRQAF
jgi:hypothetical protein